MIEPELRDRKFCNFAHAVLENAIFNKEMREAPKQAHLPTS